METAGFGAVHDYYTCSFTFCLQYIVNVGITIAYLIHFVYLPHPLQLSPPASPTSPTNSRLCPSYPHPTLPTACPAHLVSLLCRLKHIVIADFIHIPHLLQTTRCLDTHKRLLQWNRTKAAIEEEEPFKGVHSKELGNVKVAGKSSREAHDSYHLLRGLHLHTCDKSIMLENGSVFCIHN